MFASHPTPNRGPFDIPRLLIILLLCIIATELGLLLSRQQETAVDDLLSAKDVSARLKAIDESLAAATSRPAWEYHIASPDDPLFDQEMDVLGAEGWDLVAARRANSAGGVMSYEIIFKRRSAGR